MAKRPASFAAWMTPSPVPPRDLVDDVGAGVEHRFRHLQADRRIAEIVGIGDLDFRLWVDGARPLDVADNELVDADRFGAADDADHRLAAHALDLGVHRDHRRQRAGEIGSLLLLKENRGDVCPRPHLVEDHVIRAGVVLGDRLERVAVRIFEVDDEAKARVGGAAQNVGRLRHDVLRFNRLALQLVFGDAFLKPE